MNAGPLWAYLQERDHLEDLSEDDSIILKWILINKIEGCGFGLCG